MTKLSVQHSMARSVVLRGEHVSTHIVQRVKQNAVPCPDCHAQPGEPCLASTGYVLSSTHRSRKRLAIRAYFETADARIPPDLPLRIVAMVTSQRETRHVLDGIAPACGRPLNLALAEAQGHTRSGVASQINCPGCRAVLGSRAS